MEKIFFKQPLDLGAGGSNPLRPSGPLELSWCFGLPLMNLGRPPLPPNKPYCQPLNYPKYVIDVDPDAHVKVF